MDFKNYQARQGRAFRHLWQMKKFGKICLLFGSVQPISLRTLGLSENWIPKVKPRENWSAILSKVSQKLNKITHKTTFYRNSKYSRGILGTCIIFLASQAL